MLLDSDNEGQDYAFLSSYEPAGKQSCKRLPRSIRTRLNLCNAIWQLMVWDTMRKLSILLVIVVVVSLGVWVRGHRRTSCKSPLLYRIGHIDGRFTIGDWAFREVIKRAETVWEDAVGTNLLEYDSSAKFAISLIFDERQQATIERENLADQREQIERSQTRLSQSYTRTKRAYDTKRSAYENALSAYKKRVSAYNADIQRWNTKGGVPQHVYARLEREKETIDELNVQIEADRAAINEMANRMQSTKKRGHRMTDAYKTEVATFKTRYGKYKRFNQGVYNGKAIVIYQFEDISDLTLVMAHELGHALGLKHVDDPRAVMHYLMGEQDLSRLTLADDDIAALKAVCRL